MIKFAAIANILFTLCLMAVGAYTHSTSSGLNCLEWPVCYSEASVNMGSAMMHRVLVGLVLIINIFLYFYTKNKDQFSSVASKAKLGLLLLIIQSILGALSVVYEFPTLMKVVHLFLSIAYIIVLSHTVFPDFSKSDTSVQSAYNPTLKDSSFLLVAATMIQFFLGSVVKHGGAAAVCGKEFICNELGRGLSYWPVSISAKINTLHKYNSIIIIILLVIILFQLMHQKLLNKSKSGEYLKFLVALILTFSVSHFVLANKLLSMTSNNIVRVVHLMYATVLAVCFFALWDWAKKFEIAKFSKRKTTLLGDLFELTKPRLGLLVVVTIISGTLLSAEFINFFQIIFALILSTMIVASATTLNCYIEKDVDAKMERTKDRALPSGRIPPKYALVQGIILIGIAFPAMGFFVNWATAFLGLTAFLIYIFAYTPLKLRSPFALYVGAIPGAIPPVMGRTIVVGEIDTLAWILFAILFVWQLPHFLAISIYHNDDYAAGGIKVYSHSMNKGLLKLLIFLLTVILVAISVLPSYLTGAGQDYLIASLVIGVGFTLLSLVGFFVKGDSAYIAWARKYFWGSIVYLPLLMAAMIFLS